MGLTVIGAPQFFSRKDAVKSLDVETYMIQPGLLAPALVCGSTADETPNSERLLSKKETRGLFRSLLEGKEQVVGANIVYDFGVMCADDSSLLPLVFKALEEDRVIDTHVLEALHDIGRGRLFVSDDGRPFNRYSLGLLVERYLGIDISDDKHGENSWRLRYGELDSIPQEQWPEEAREYPKRDARYTMDVARFQLGLSGGGEHDFVALGPVPKDEWQAQSYRCKACGFETGSGVFAPLCKNTKPVRHNIECLGHEMRAAWALHLQSVWGIRTDPVRVSEVVGEIRQKHEESRQKFLQHGLVKLRRARGGKEPEVPDLFDEKGKGLKYATDTKKLHAMVSDAYKGKPPYTETGRVQADRLTLADSGNDLLEEFAEAGPNEKLFSTYVSILEQGTKVPINPEINVLVASGRASVRKPPLQTLPRKGVIRECFTARKSTLLCSIDYGGGELCTWAQVCLDWFGRSELAKALNEGQDVHLALAASIAKIDYDEAFKLYKAKDAVILNLRQSAKPANFGLPGGMGPVKLVAAARKEGVKFCVMAGIAPVCPACGGEKKEPKCKECDGHGRVCVAERVTEYRYSQTREPMVISPTCSQCLSLGIAYRDAWRKKWPESREYHERVNAVVEAGKPIISFGNGMERGEVGFTDGSNHPFQNLLAFGAKKAAWAVAKECYVDRESILFGCRPVLFVHDEIIAELPEATAHLSGPHMAKVMRDVLQEVCPDVPIKAEPALMRRWIKGADAAFDETGKLIPWEDRKKAA